MGYRLYDPQNRSVTTSRNDIFDEKKFIFEDRGTAHSKESSSPDNQNDTENQESAEDENLEEKEEITEDLISRPKRESRFPEKFKDFHLYQACLALEENISYEDIQHLSEKEQQCWKQAMDEEIQSMKENKVWDLVDLPKGATPISCKWVYKLKENGTYKARLVARGFMQKKNVDYKETYTPVLTLFLFSSY